MSQENIYITQIRLGRKTKEEVIDHLKENIKREAELLQQSIENDSSFIILDVNNHVHQLQKYNTFLWEVANYQGEPGKWKSSKIDTVNILIKQN